MKQFWLIRHGQSEGNIDKPQAYRGAPPLTEKGWQQVRGFADTFEATPDLIVASTFIRAQQSAEPLRTRFPDAAYEIWPVHEFTPLASVHYENVAMSTRKPLFLKFFEDGDAYTENGEGSESFSQGIERGAALLAQLRDRPFECATIYTHATFLRMVYWVWLYGNAETANANMIAFGDFRKTLDFPNCGHIHGYVHNDTVYFSPVQTTA